MGVDYNVVLDMERGPVSPTEVTVVREQSTHTNRWRLCGSLLAMALCVSAALFFTLHAKKQDQTEEADDIRHTLRQISGTAKGSAAIHLEGVYNSDYSETSVEWRDNVDQGFSQGGLKLENNKIVIPRSGLYFVYSQASFRVSCHADPKHQVNHRMVHLSHTVQRWSKTYGIGSGKSDEYQTLLNSVRTACEKMPSSDPESKGPWFSVVSMGAVFHLEEGDKLKTLTPHRLMSDLEDDSGKTFFGVFAL